VSASLASNGADVASSATEAADVIAEGLESQRPVFLQSTQIEGFPSEPVRVQKTSFADVPKEMGFRRWPQPAPGSAGFR